MRFAAPQFLYLLLVVPGFVGFFLWAMRKRETLMTRFIQARLLPGLVSGVSPVRQKIRMSCLLAAIICLIIALARPQWGFTLEEVKQRGLDIVVAIDTSKSMLAEDIAPNRLARAKLAALDLMQQAKSDRLGVVAFAGNAFLECPLTIDETAFRQAVEALDVNTIPQGGTAIADAIETAQTAFKEGENYKVVVLMTDGEDHDSGAIEAAKKAAQSGVRIYTIGIGTPEGELLRVKDAQGQPNYVRDDQGNVVKSHLNQELLEQIATATSAFYLPLRGAKTIDTLFQHPQGIASLPKSEHQERVVRQYQERYYWPLSIAILLLLFEILFPERKREAVVHPSIPARVRVPVAQSAAICLIAFGITLSARASSSGALREYKEGNYQQALKEYQQMLKRKADDPRLHFNAGAAAYQNRQFDEAAKQFEAALNSPDLRLQDLAYYNRGNTLFRLGEQNSDPAKKTESWEKSLKDFESSLKLNPQDSDAKYNHEFVKRKLEELKQQQQQQKNQNNQQNPEPSEEAKKAKAASDEAVRQRQYAKALEIMEQQLQKDPTTAYYNDYIERLKEVNGVQANPNH